MAGKLRLCAVMLALVAATACTAGQEPLKAASAWARQRGWKARPVAESSLERPKWMRMLGWSDYRNLPFAPTDDLLSDIYECRRLAYTYGKLRDSKLVFLGDDVRLALEKMVRKRPDFFYAEFLLGNWHRLHDDSEQSRKYFESAYKHAPVVLVQRYKQADGRPWIDDRYGEYTVQCWRTKKGKPEGVQLVFTGLATDPQGCIYLPVHDTVLHTYQMTVPRPQEGYDLDYDLPFYYEAESKVAVLPAVTVCRGK